MIADTHSAPITIRRALVSVYDKTGLLPLARALAHAGVEIVSTGSTARTIAEAGIAVTPVEKITDFPECLDGRVKTLHPRIHAGILADTRKTEHLNQLSALGIEAFQLVVVNLYPFAETVRSGADYDACVEQIDIGGPSMVRAAAKNHASVAVVVSPERYDEVIAAVSSPERGFDYATRRALARDAYQHTAAYDIAVATWFDEQIKAESSEENAAPSSWLGASYTMKCSLRYGENPHQSAALYLDDAATGGIARATQIHGKEMSYNNYTDGDAAWRAVWEHDEPCVAIIKHANPCGIAVHSTSIAEAHRLAHACDPLSAFGGIIAANRTVTREMAETVRGIFTEAVIAPAFDDDALAILAKKKNIRLLVSPHDEHSQDISRKAREHREISGGLLVQDRDYYQAEGDDPSHWTLVAGSPATAETLKDLVFAWRAVRAVKSNAILLAKNGATVGIGMGQVNRVDSAHLAVTRANTLAGEIERAKGAVAASDAFFPFADGFTVLADAGVVAVVQPGGSIRDHEVIDAANAAGVTMYLTGTRHFYH